jgi:cell division protein ZapE
MDGGAAETYRKRAAAGDIEFDSAQLAAAERLDDLARELVRWRPARRGFFAALRREDKATPKGVYLHGGVGRGKTMLMDLFFAGVAFAPKRRLHFHEFMAEVHDRIAQARKSVDGDPIPHVAREIAQNARLLCFDELHVTDIADAMILGRLFKELFEDQVVLVATSNAHPGDLYKNGLNRQLFLPFVDLIEDHLDVVELKAAKDFRMEKLAGSALYFTPDDAQAAEAIRGLWSRLTGGAAAAPVQIEVKGRAVAVPAAAMGVSRFSFADLCEQPLGSLDYLHIAHAFHTVIVEHIPVLSPVRRNAARRFINLIDTLYDQRVCLIASAEAEPAALYPAGDGADLFERTVSRLIEMRSAEYLAARGERALAPVPVAP